jgi:RHS repeat-associated protein
VKGFNRNYSYDAAGYVTSDGKRTYTWTSFGQLKQLVYESAPELRDLTGFIRYAAGRVQSEFDFDAAGGRARQVKERIAPNDSREIETTLYLGAYERENHTTRANELASPVLVKTVHRHSLGGGMIYTRTFGGSEPGTKLTNVLKDHLGSTDALVVGIWNGSTFANQSIERLSFDAWGERRDATTQISYRASDADPFRTSAKDHDRGYTGHEQLDDSGLIHMNGRIYDPELGRFLSPDPIVQIPEYSQNFNRYSYVLNNPLNATDPSGFSFISKAFSKIGSFIKENWRTVVMVVVATVAMIFAGPILGGAISGAFNAAITGGDIARSALTGAITGAFSAALGNYGPIIKAVGSAIASGVGNVIMGGKFQDGFITSIKYSAIFGMSKEIGKMAFSHLNKNNLESFAGIERKIGMQLNRAGYRVQRMWYDNPGHTIDSTKLGLPEGWEFEENGYYQDPSGSSNLDYATFVNKAKGIRFMSMIGTQNDRWGADWIDDAKQALGIKTKQYIRAIEFAISEQDISQKMGYDFVISGHSLGGGLAAAASAVTGAPALIFNAAGVNPLTLHYAGYGDLIKNLGSNVVSYNVGGEILTSGQFALSAMIPTAASANHYTFWPRNFPFSTWNPATLHRPEPTFEAVR